MDLLTRIIAILRKPDEKKKLTLCFIQLLNQYDHLRRKLGIKPVLASWGINMTHQQQWEADKAEAVRHQYCCAIEYEQWDRVSEFLDALTEANQKMNKLLAAAESGE